MIRSDKVPNALYSLNAVLVWARFFASDRHDTKAVTEVLDYAEELPRLIASAEDQTEEFRVTLMELASRFKELTMAVERFDSQDVPSRW